jgi:hypothetical protein
MKNPFQFRVVLFALAALLWASASQAQDTPANRPSPPATATGKVGASTVTVNYGSPSVKGRPVWGELVPYDQVWRAGANEATTIEFTKPVKVEGKELAAGKYGFFTIPGKDEWTVIFNKVPNQWGAFKYDEKQDALRVKAKPRKAASPSERLVYDVTGKGLVLRWENLELPIAMK